MQPISRCPPPSLLLLPLKPFRRLLPSLLGLPVLPPASAARAPAPMVSLSCVPLSCQPRPTTPAHQPWPAVPPNPPRHPLEPRSGHPHQPCPTTPQTPPKSTPRRLKSFLEKTLTAHARTPISTPRHPAAHAPGRLTQPAPAPPQISRPGPHPAGSVPQPPANTPQPSKRPPKTRQSSRPREPEPPLGVRAPGGASTPQNARRNRRSTPPQTARPRPSA